MDIEQGSHNIKVEKLKPIEGRGVKLTQDGNYTPIQCRHFIIVKPASIPAVCAAMLDCDEDTLRYFVKSQDTKTLESEPLTCPECGGRAKRDTVGYGYICTQCKRHFGETKHTDKPEPHVMCPECCDSPLRRIEYLESDPSKKRYVFFCGHEFEMVEDEPEPESDWAKIRDLNEDTLCTDKPDPYAEPEFEFEAGAGVPMKIIDNGDGFDCYADYGNGDGYKPFNILLKEYGKTFWAKIIPYMQARLSWRKQEEWKRV